MKDDHLKDCPSMLVQCDLCKLFMVQKEFASHGEICPEKFIYCSQMCGDRIKRKDENAHQIETCSETVAKPPLLKKRSKAP